MTPTGKHKSDEVIDRLKSQLQQVVASSQAQAQAPNDSLVGADPESDQHQVARTILLRQLSVTPKSRAELAKKLAEKDVSAEIAEQVLDRFEQVQLIDDQCFARSWVESRHRSKGLAKGALSRELYAKGITPEDAELALKQLDEDDEYRRGTELVQRKLGSRTIPGTSTPEERVEHDKLVRRLVGMLSRKGYRPGMAFSIVKDVLNSQHLDEPM